MKRNSNQYSNSELETYNQCKFKYRLQYLSDTESSFDIIEAFMGNRVHNALEKLYRDSKMMKLLSVDELASFYNEIWEKHWNETIHIVRKEYTKEDYRRTGEKYIRDFYKRYAPFDQDKTIDLETRFKFSLIEKYTISGIMDRLAEEDGVFVIHDYKTSNTLPTQEEIDNDRQLGLYLLGVKSKWPDVKVRLVYHFLAFDKELKPSIEKTAEDIENFKKEILEEIRKIESTEEFLAEEKGLCSWCEYQPYCPKRKHLFKVEALPKELYHEDDGVKLVDKYVELWDKSKQLEMALNEAKENLIEFARQEQVEAVKGSNYKVYVKAGIRKTFPSKDDKGRKELEALLKQSGKWNEVSILWLSFLEERASSGEWDQEFVKQVKLFQLEKENKWVSQPYRLSIIP